VAELSRKRRTVPHAYNALKHRTKQLIRYLREEWHCKIGRVANYQGDEKRERRARRRKQGLKFRRNFAEFRRNFSFPLGTGKKYFSIFGKFCFEKSKFKKIRPKFTEIHRNSGTEFRFRQSPGFHRKTKWLTLVVLTICYLPIPQWLLLGKKTIFIAYYLLFLPH